MPILSSAGKAKLLVLAIAVLLTSIISGVAILSFKDAPNTQLKEAESDLQVNIGSSYPGIADLVSVSVAKNQTTLNTAITVKDPIVPLTEKEIANYNMILILENEDIIQTYELRIDLNSSGLFGSIQNVQLKTQQRVELLIDGSTLKVSANLAELKDATKAEWNINSTYEKLSDNQIVSSAWDFIPNQGLNTTVF